MPQDKEQSITQNSRRGFIKTTALAAAGFMILPRHVLGGKGFLAPGDRLQLAGIGAGGKVRATLPTLLKVERQM